MYVYIAVCVEYRHISNIRIEERGKMGSQRKSKASNHWVVREEGSQLRGSKGQTLKLTNKHIIILCERLREI